MEVVGTTLGPTPARRVSWIPGAEGAPRECDCRWEWVVEWLEEGAILIACERLVDVLKVLIQVRLFEVMFLR